MYIDYYYIIKNNKQYLKKFNEIDLLWSDDINEAFKYNNLDDAENVVINLKKLDFNVEIQLLSKKIY